MRKQQIDGRLKEILEKYGIDPDDDSNLWETDDGVLVLYHSAYEIIAAKENIVWDIPSVHVNGDVVAIMARAKLGDRIEWSVGECSPDNHRGFRDGAAYPFAMAEKRAKDRVISKLVGLAPYVYSEVEADGFKRPARKAKPKAEKPQKEEEESPSGPYGPIASDEHEKALQSEPDSVKGWKIWEEAVRMAIEMSQNVDDLLVLWNEQAGTMAQADPVVSKDLRAQFTARRLVLEKKGK